MFFFMTSHSSLSTTPIFVIGIVETVEPGNSANHQQELFVPIHSRLSAGLTLVSTSIWLAIILIFTTYDADSWILQRSVPTIY
jgi:hypothetical protein